MQRFPNKACGNLNKIFVANKIAHKFQLQEELNDIQLKGMFENLKDKIIV